MDSLLTNRERDRQLEILVLRHQLNVLQRTAIFKSEGVEVIRLPFRAPRANAIGERWVSTVRCELLDHLLNFGRLHLESVLMEFLVYYHQARPHQGLEQRCPADDVSPQSRIKGGLVARHDRLGGLLQEYRWAA